MTSDDEHVYRLNANALFQYEFDGTLVQQLALPAQGELLHLAEGDGKLAAITDSCAQIFIIDKESKEFVKVVTGVESVGGRRGIVFQEARLICAGNDFLFSIDPSTGEIVNTLTTEDVTTGVETVSYEDLLASSGRTMLRVRDRTARDELIFIDENSLAEVGRFPNQQIANVQRWYLDDSGDGFLSAVYYPDVGMAIFHADFDTGAAVQVTPTQNATHWLIGIGFGWDDDYYYWIRVSNDVQQVVRYPISQMNVQR
jgi:hypothetical protein